MWVRRSEAVALAARLYRCLVVTPSRERALDERRDARATERSPCRRCEAALGLVQLQLAAEEKGEHLVRALVLDVLLRDVALALPATGRPCRR